MRAESRHSNWLIGAILAAAFLLPPTAPQAQEHVRLMPQQGMGLIYSVAFSPDGRFGVDREQGSDDRQELTVPTADKQALATRIVEAILAMARSQRGEG